MSKREYGALALDEFLKQLRACSQKLAVKHADRAKILTEAAELFAQFSAADEVVLLDFSRSELDVHKASNRKDGGSSKAVILEESVELLVDSIYNWFSDEQGIRIFDRKVLDAPKEFEAEAFSQALDQLELSQGVILPLKVMRNFGGQNIQGMLLLKGVPNTHFADPIFLALAGSALDMLSLISDNMDMGDALSRLRQADSMTGLASKNKFLSQLCHEIERAQYFKRPFSIVHADIDNSRLVNADHGYRYGDLIIKTIAELLLGESRPIDLVCRWAGEEYILLLPEMGKDEAFEFAEHCRKKAEAMPITPDEFRKEVFVTLSFGVVSYPEHGNYSDLLVRNAEIALLKAKLDGRNRTVVWSEALKA